MRNKYQRMFDLEELHQIELLFDNNNCPVGINTHNFIRDLQWNNMQKEIDAIKCIQVLASKGFKGDALQLHGK